MQADLENGYTRIANELIDNLAQIDLSGREFRVLLVIMRRTYGFQKKMDWIALPQLVDSTGISKANLSRIITELEKKKIILRDGSGYIKKVGINTRTLEWLSRKEVVESDNGDVAKRQRRKENKLSNPTTKIVENDNTFVESDNGDVAKRQPQKKKENRDKEKKENIQEGFESLWACYPKRIGSNPKNHAFSSVNARIAEGHTFEEMAAGLSRYIAYCLARGSTGTEYVMQTVRFFGKSKEFENDWTFLESGNGNSQQPSRKSPSASQRTEAGLREYIAELSQ